MENLEQLSPSTTQSEGEKQLQVILQPLFDDEGLEYSDFILEVAENIEYDIQIVLNNLTETISELGNSELELVIEEFIDVGMGLDDVETLSEILLTRYNIIEKENANLENKDANLENKDANLANKNDNFIDVKDTNFLKSEYGIDINDFIEEKEEAGKQVDIFLDGKDISNLERNSLIIDYLILKKKDLFLQKFKESSDYSQERYDQLHADLIIQDNRIKGEKPDFYVFVHTPLLKNTPSVVPKFPEDGKINHKNDSLVGPGFGGKRVEINGNITRVGDIKLVTNSDGSLSKSLVSKNGFELQTKMPRGVDIYDYTLSLKKMKTKADTITAKMDELQINVSEIEGEMKKIANIDISAMDPLEVAGLQADYESYQGEKSTFEMQLENQESEFADLQIDYRGVMKSYQADRLRYQLASLKEDEKTREIKEYLSRTGFDLFPQSLTNQLIAEVKANIININGLALNPETMVLSEGRFGENGTEEGGTKWKENLVKFMNKMLSGNTGEPLDVGSHISIGGKQENPTEIINFMEINNIRNPGSGVMNIVQIRDNLKQITKDPDEV